MHLIIHGFKLSTDNSNEALSRGIYSLLRICQQFKLDADGFWVSDMSLKKRNSRAHSMLNLVILMCISTRKIYAGHCMHLDHCLKTESTGQYVLKKEPDLRLFIVFPLTQWRNKRDKKGDRYDNSKHSSLRVKMKV